MIWLLYFWLTQSTSSSSFLEFNEFVAFTFVKSRCKYFSSPPFFGSKSVTTCPSPCSTHFVVSSPLIPTGPRAWIRPVLIPTSAPSPNLYPSANLVLALWKTQALSTWLRNLSATASYEEEEREDKRVEEWVVGSKWDAEKWEEKKTQVVWHGKMAFFLNF